MIYDILLSFVEFPKGSFLLITTFISLTWFMHIVKQDLIATNKTIIAFKLYVLASFVWMITNAYFQSELLILSNSKFRLLMALLSNIGGCFATVSVYYLSCLLKSFKVSKISWFFILFVSFSNVFLNFYPGLTVVNVEIIDAHHFNLVQGPLSGVYFLIISILIIPTIINMILAFKKSRDIESRKMLFFLGGTVFMYASAIMTNVLLPLLFNNYSLVWTSPSMSLVIIITFGYAMITQRFSSLKQVINRQIKILFALSISIIIALIAKHYIIIDFLNHSPVLSSIFLYILVIYFFQKIKYFFNSKIFYKIFGITNSDYFIRLINEFIESYKSYTHLADLISDIKVLFVKKLKISKAEIIIFDQLSELKYQKIITYFKKNNQIFISKEVIYKEKQLNIKNHTSKLLYKLGEICLPLYNSTGSLIGLFILGKKPFNEIYSKEEIESIEQFGHYLSLDLSGVLYTSQLQKEVSEKTKILREQTVTLKKQKVDLEHSFKKLQELDNAKDEFMDVASHELRTPMTNIRGYTEFLLTKRFGDINVQQQDFLDRIFKNSTQMIELINDILDVLKLEAGKFVFKYEYINLNEFMQARLKHFQKKFADGKITVEYQNKLDQEFQIYIAEYPLEKLINNLLDNVYKFTPEDGLAKVEVDLSPKDNKQLIVSIWNSGEGIPADKQDVIFEKFQHAENHMIMKHGGSGLGLAIVKKILMQFQGDIKVESKLGEGVRMIVSLPVANLNIERKN